MIVFDLFLGNALNINFLIKIAISVFLGAGLTGVIVKKNSVLSGSIVGVLAGLISYPFYLQAKNGINAIPFNEILFPILISVISGPIGGFFGGFLRRNLISQTV